MMQRKISVGNLLNKEMAFALVFSSVILEEFVRSVLNVIGIGSNSLVGLINVLTCILALVIFMFDGQNTRAMIKGNLIKTGLVGFSIIVMWIASIFLLGQEMMYFNGQLIRFVPLAVLYFYCGTQKINYTRFTEKLRFVIPIAIIYGMLTIMFEKMDVVYLNLAYNIMPWIVISHILLKQKKRTVFLFEMLILIGELVISGARMPLLCIVLYFFAVFFWKKTISKNSFLIIVLLIVVGGVFIICKGSGGSRSIEMLLNGSFFKSNERIIIYKYLMSQILEEPFTVRGLFADRIMLGNEFAGTNGLGFYLSAEAKNNTYAHNLIIEIMSDFGLGLGILLLCPFGLILFKSVGNLRRNDDLTERYFGFLMIVLGLAPLLVSSSFLVNFSFWMMLGWLVAASPWKYIDEY